MSRSGAKATLLDFSRPHVLADEAEYEAAVAEIGRLLDEDPGSGTEGFQRLEFLSVLVEHYEEERYPTDAVTPQQAVAFMMEQKSLDRADLEQAMGGKSRVSEFFGGKRELSKAQIEALRGLLGIPADVLLGFAAKGAPRVDAAQLRADHDAVVDPVIDL